MAKKGQWLRLVGEQDARAGKSIDAFYAIPKRTSGFVMRHSEGERASYEIGYRATKDEMRKDKKFMKSAIPDTVRPMPEPLRTLLLEGIRHAGNLNPDIVLCHVEEYLTPEELTKVVRFLVWLNKNKLTVGHGTISLRWDEFLSKRAPASQDEAYQWAIKKAGV